MPNPPDETSVARSTTSPLKKRIGEPVKPARQSQVPPPTNESELDELLDEEELDEEELLEEELLDELLELLELLDEEELDEELLEEDEDSLLEELVVEELGAQEEEDDPPPEELDDDPPPPWELELLDDEDELQPPPELDELLLEEDDAPEELLLENGLLEDELLEEGPVPEELLDELELLVEGSPEELEEELNPLLEELLIPELLEYGELLLDEGDEEELLNQPLLDDMCVPAVREWLNRSRLLIRAPKKRRIVSSRGTRLQNVTSRTKRIPMNCCCKFEGVRLRQSAEDAQTAQHTSLLSLPYSQLQHLRVRDRVRSVRRQRTWRSIR